MATSRKPLLALLIGLAALGLASCGESENAELLPGRTASEISANLDEVRRLAGEGDCIGAQDAALEVSDQVDALGGVDAELKTALRDGALRLNEVVAACEEEAAEEEEESELSTEPEEVEETEPEEKAKPDKQSEAPGQEKKAEKEAAEPKEESPPTGKGEPPVEPPEPPSGTPSGGVSPGAVADGEEGED